MSKLLDPDDLTYSVNSATNMCDRPMPVQQNQGSHQGILCADFNPAAGA